MHQKLKLINFFAAKQISFARQQLLNEAAALVAATIETPKRIAILKYY